MPDTWLILFVGLTVTTLRPGFTDRNIRMPIIPDDSLQKSAYNYVRHIFTPPLLNAFCPTAKFLFGPPPINVPFWYRFRLPSAEHRRHPSTAFPSSYTTSLVSIIACDNQFLVSHLIHKPRQIGSLQILKHSPDNHFENLTFTHFLLATRPQLFLDYGGSQPAYGW